MAKKSNKKKSKKTTAKAAAKKTNTNNKVKQTKPAKQEKKSKEKPKKKDNDQEFFLIRWFKSVISFFGGVKSELGKVVWPTKSELGQSTAVVIIMVTAFTIFVWGFDTIVGYLVNLLYGLL